MDNSAIIRDIVIQNLKREQDFDSIVSAVINGNYFSAADIAIPDSNGNCEVYRMIVIKHNKQKNFA